MPLNGLTFQQHLWLCPTINGVLRWSETIQLHVGRGLDAHWSCTSCFLTGAHERKICCSVSGFSQKSQPRWVQNWEMEKTVTHTILKASKRHLKTTTTTNPHPDEVGIWLLYQGRCSKVITYSLLQHSEFRNQLASTSFELPLCLHPLTHSCKFQKYSLLAFPVFHDKFANTVSKHLLGLAQTCPLSWSRRERIVSFHHQGTRWEDL